MPEFSAWDMLLEIAAIVRRFLFNDRITEHRPTGDKMERKKIMQMKRKDCE